MTEQKVSVWLPDATNLDLEWLEATDYICEHWAELDDAWWEWREVGVDIEETWTDNGNPVYGLEKALDIVMPHWRNTGMNHVRAAALAMDIGLICSVSEWEPDSD